MPIGTKLKPFELDNIPFKEEEKKYGIPLFGVQALDLGLVKYFGKPDRHVYHDHLDYFTKIISEFDLPIDPDTMSNGIYHIFLRTFKGIKAAYHEKNSDQIIRLMTHTNKGTLRKETSCGPGYTIKRKELARNYSDLIRELVESDFEDIPVFYQLFLKDELREIVDGKVKNTRSIAVPFISSWIQTMKYLGWLYDYLESTMCSTPIKYGMDTTPVLWTHAFSDFDCGSEAEEADLVGQDKYMDAGFLTFFREFLFLIGPDEGNYQNFVYDFFEKHFFEKQVIAAHGRVYTFSTGNMSGGPITIIINCFHNFYYHAVNMYIAQVKRQEGELRKGLVVATTFTPYPLAVLGDDTAAQMGPMLLKQYARVLELANLSLTSGVFPFSNGVSFLSKRMYVDEGMIVPYYCNIDKLKTTIMYTSAGVEEYFEKICSLVRETALAPPGSEAYEVCKILNSFAQELMHLFASELSERSNTFVSLPKLRASLLGHQVCLPNLKTVTEMSEPRQSRSTVRKARPRPPSKGRQQSSAAAENKALNLKVQALEQRVSALKSSKTAHFEPSDAQAKKFIENFGFSRLTDSKSGWKWSLMPRPLPTRVFPGCYHRVIQGTLPTGKALSVTIRPACNEEFCQISSVQEYTGGNLVMTFPDANTSAIPHGSRPPDIFFDMPLVVGDQTFYPTTVSTNLTSYVCTYNSYTGEYELRITNELPLFVGFLTAPNPTSTLYVSDNPGNILHLRWSSFNSNGALINQTTAAGAGAPMPVPATLPTAGAYFGVGLGNSGIASLERIRGTLTFNADIAHLSTKKYLPCEDQTDTFTAIRDTSSSWDMTHCSALLNVGTNSQWNGGFGCVALVPQDYELPLVPGLRYNALNALNTNHYHAALTKNTGFHGIWMGEKIQDYEFQRTASNLVKRANTLEFVLTPQDMTGTYANSMMTFSLEFTVLFEFIHGSPSLPKMLGPPCYQMWSTFINAIITRNYGELNPLVGENASHTTRIRNFIERLKSDPAVMHAAKEALKAGGRAALTMLPLVFA